MYRNKSESRNSTISHKIDQIGKKNEESALILDEINLRNILLSNFISNYSHTFSLLTFNQTTANL